ncbi:3-isopropylmalate dehydratase small subunit [Pseudacidovorax sp. RU35E]|uniref:3-isopropylmalate dehydratase small subunit n=1 Tax=Pseudacidovorax sp. RU35E TaxID=1907403 RepID=UPI000956862C|nr:3-isopropylmalate dehydratase small subunit [Pseudacidovorax sp. RU35E]SIQ51707.1 3-isopropylmalate/(R)-2-methylmalate dehydratase small subunit [Pseudacidovorax sp. RU35E]
MEALQQVTGVAAPLLRINIDTDQIIPTIFLGGTDAKGYGAHLFHWWRFRPDGQPDPDFILNQPPYDHAQILLADRNFGCGSSRERAPKALREFGFRAILAPSFGGIFYNNCWRNGMVPVELPIAQIRQIADEVAARQGRASVTVDLQALCVRTAGGLHFAFEAPATLRDMLLQGVDEIALTLGRQDEIAAFRQRDRLLRPWAY